MHVFYLDLCRSQGYPFARWDGIVAILPPDKKRAILPDEVRDIKTYVNRHRKTVEPFDIVVILWSEGENTQEEQEESKKYAEAGVTWWLEDLSTERFATLKQVRERLYKGPPA